MDDARSQAPVRFVRPHNDAPNKDSRSVRSLRPHRKNKSKNAADEMILQPGIPEMRISRETLTKKRHRSAEPSESSERLKTPPRKIRHPNDTPSKKRNGGAVSVNGGARMKIVVHSGAHRRRKREGNQQIDDDDRILRENPQKQREDNITPKALPPPILADGKDVKDVKDMKDAKDGNTTKKRKRVRKSGGKEMPKQAPAVDSEAMSLRKRRRKQRIEDEPFEDIDIMDMDVSKKLEDAASVNLTKREPFVMSRRRIEDSLDSDPMSLIRKRAAAAAEEEEEEHNDYEEYSSDVPVLYQP